MNKPKKLRIRSTVVPVGMRTNTIVFKPKTGQGSYTRKQKHKKEHTHE